MAIKHIAEGWFNSFLDSINLLDSETKKLGETRMNICTSCPIRKIKRCSSDREGIHADGSTFKGCGCYVDKKVLCHDCQCPGGYWPKI